MKKIFIVCLCVFICGQSKSQYKEMDEKIEFLGVPFLSAPDYSQISYSRAARNSNIYIFKSPKAFTTPDYSLSAIDISVSKGRVSNFTCEVMNETDFAKINQDLANAFSDTIPLEKGTMYFGKNLTFWPWQENGRKRLFITTNKSDTVTDVKDNSGIIDLLGKKDTDPGVMNLIASIPGKKEKKEYSTGGYGYTWPAEGIVIDFKGKEGDATINYIGIYFMKDNYYWREKPFKGSIKLPYGITANTSLLQLRDLFGDEDKEFGSSSWRTKNYKKFKVYCNFGDPVKQNKDDLLNHISFK